MAGQAVEDALFLSWILAHPAVKLSNTSDALAVYDAIRRPRASRVLQRSLEAGDIYEFAGPMGADREKIRAELEVMHDWVWQHNHDDDFVAAEKHMRQRNMIP
jgi:salicylate hydroxylase